MWMVSFLANGMSAATNSTPLSMSFEIKATFPGEPVELGRD
jgi:hypothetical protein